MKEVMDDLKDVVTRTLEKKGVLAKIRAELRASVFTAIDEQEGKEGGLAAQGSARAARLHASSQGQLVAELVREYLEWCELEYTLKVFLPEVNTAGEYMGRMRLEEKLGMRPTPPDSDGEKPLLLSLLDAFQRGGGPSNPASPAAMGGSSHGELKSPEGSESPVLTSVGAAAAPGPAGGSRSPPPDASPEGGGASSPFVVTRDGSAFVKDSSEDLYSTVRRADPPAPAGGGGGEAPEGPAGSPPAAAAPAPKPLGAAGLGKLDPLPALGGKRLGGLEPLAPLRTGMGGLAPLGGGEGGGAGGLAPLRGAPLAPQHPEQGAGATEAGAGAEEGLDKSRSTSHVSPREAAAESSEGSIGEEFEVEEDEGLALDEGSEDSYVFADDTHTSLMSKGQSMDLMVSGLSASDRSGELDGSDNDFMESAEIGA